MQIPHKTLKNGFSLPIYGLGTWHMGGYLTASKDKKRDEIEINAIKTAIDAGVTHIDTAEMYGNGHAEELIKQALIGYDRSTLTLTSKVKPNHFKYEDVLDAAKRSLERLGTEYLDLYLLHMPNPGIDIQDTMRAMDELKSQGLVRNIGVSNFSTKRFLEAQSTTKNTLVANQMLYNLHERFVEEDKLLPYCQEHDVLLIAYTPVHKGAYAKNQLPIMKELTEKYHKTVSQIALNWLTTKPNVVTISKTVHKQHLDENLAAFDFVIDQEDITRLDMEFPHKKKFATYDADIRFKLIAQFHSFFG